jgi:hypothetical protein
MRELCEPVFSRHTPFFKVLFSSPC